MGCVVSAPIARDDTDDDTDDDERESMMRRRVHGKREPEVESGGRSTLRRQSSPADGAAIVAQRSADGAATVQRVSLDEEEPLQGRFAVVQRTSLEEEEPLQGRFEVAQRASVDEEEVQLQQAPPRNATGLPDGLKAGVESLSGVSLDDVRVHYNSAQPAQLNALAFAQGTDIHVAPGQERHLPHEAWHVVQQAQGRVKPTVQLQPGVPVNDDEALEHEADTMGAKALTMPVQRQVRSVPVRATIQGWFTSVRSRGSSSPGTAVVQREEFIGDASRHHMHIDIAQPHYKNGKSKASRIEIGGAGNTDYRQADLERVIEVVKGRLTEAGATECRDWCVGEARRIKRL